MSSKITVDLLCCKGAPSLLWAWHFQTVSIHNEQLSVEMWFCVGVTLLGNAKKGSGANVVEVQS